ncbi:MAG: COX15/CtaA family protein [Anaerolineae bacterium]|nr:COX15/CtaA family protein [Anaerolineae bacterium]
MQLTRFAWYAWFVLGYNVLVILWGAVVRATGSGAGCGAHWPLCNGEVVPMSAQTHTLIEFSHRLSSGLALLVVGILAVWAFRAYPKGSLVRRGAVLSVIFILTEALLGAGLVLFELVAHDASLTRAVSMALHLVNTFILLGALTLTAWWASGGGPLRIGQRRGLAVGLILGLIGTAIIGASGAIVALGDTLFPSASLAEGLSQDLDATAHFLVRLRVVHPIIAILVGVGLILLAQYAKRRAPAANVNRMANIVTTLVLIQWAAGFINVILLAPVWMQLVHLLLADLVWIALVLLGATALSQPEAVAAADATRVGSISTTESPAK